MDNTIKLTAPTLTLFKEDSYPISLETMIFSIVESEYASTYKNFESVFRFLENSLGREQRTDLLTAILHKAA